MIVTLHFVITNVTTDITTMAAIPLLEKYNKLEVM